MPTAFLAGHRPPPPLKASSSIMMGWSNDEKKKCWWPSRLATPEERKDYLRRIGLLDENDNEGEVRNVTVD